MRQLPVVGVHRQDDQLSVPGSFADVRTVNLSQSFLQRIFGVGKIGISSTGQSDVEISVSGQPDPENIKEAIDSRRHAYA